MPSCGAGFDIACSYEGVRSGVGLMDSVLTQGFMGISSHPMNSSQNFLGLLGLCEVGNHPDPEVRLALLGRMRLLCVFICESLALALSGSKSTARASL